MISSSRASPSLAATNAATALSANSARDDEVDDLLGQDLEQRDTDGHRDEHVDRERGRRAEPHEIRAAARRQHERREHRLVGQLADEDDGEDSRDDRELHRYSIGTTGRAFASSWWRYSLIPYPVLPS